MHQPIATWNPARGVWETSETNLFCEHSELYSATWPASGSMRNGSAYRRPPSARRTSGGASSSSPGLPTPRARNWKTGGKDGLDEALRLLPTPTTSEGTGPGHAARGGMNLRTTISLLPTPRATDGEKGGPNQRGSAGDLTLPSVAHRLGEPTKARSDAGNTSSDVQLPGQLTIEDA